MALCLGVAVCLGAAGCASSGSTSEPNAETSREPDGTAGGGQEVEPSPFVEGLVADATAVIVDDHGDLNGFAVAAVALDSGYTVTQVVTNPSIDADGILPGVTPGGSPLGLLASPEPQGLRSVGAAPPQEREFALFEMTLQEIHITGAQAIAKRVLAEREFQEQVVAEERQEAEAQFEGARVLSVVFLLLAQGYSFEQAIEAIIFDDYEVGGGCARRPELPAGPEIEAISAGCEIASDLTRPTEPANDAPPPETSAEISEGDPVTIEPQQELWEGDLVPNPELIDDPVAGGFVLSRAAGTDQFEITIATTDAKTNTATTDGFDEVECSSEWSSVYEGTGTFWEINDLGIEFEGTITRDIVYVAGPCTSQVENEVSAFSGVVVFIAENGMELSFNGWSVEIPGPPPTPVDR